MPDTQAALDKYRRGIATYDDSNRHRRLRRRCAELLVLRLGDAVLDAGCGTGLSFPLLEAAVAGAMYVASGRKA